MPGAGQGSLSAGYWNPVSVSCPVTGLFLSSGSPICPRRPGLQRETIRRLAAYQLHGNFIPRRISPGCPHLLRRPTAGCAASTLDFMAGQKYHCPHCLSSPCRELPGSHGPLFLAPHRGYMAQELFLTTECPLCRIRPVHRGAAAIVAHAHHNSNGKDLMDGYGIVKVHQRPVSSPYGVRKEALKISFYLSVAQIRGQNETSPKKFFIFFSNCRLLLRMVCSDTPYFRARFRVQLRLLPSR